MKQIFNEIMFFFMVVFLAIGWLLFLGAIEFSTSKEGIWFFLSAIISFGISTLFSTHFLIKMGQKKNDKKI